MQRTPMTFSTDELDEQLKQLAIAAQRHPPKTSERHIALTALVSKILSSGRLYRPSPSRLPTNLSGAYEDIYDEAKQELMLHICQKIDEYNPERGKVMTWVNLLMERRFFNKAISQVRNQREQQAIANSSIADIGENLSPSTALISGTKLTLSKEMSWFIEQDPDNLFVNTYIEAQPKANFQTLLQKRLADISWKEISAELGIPVPTLSSFYQRCLKIFAPKFREYLSQ